LVALSCGLGVAGFDDGDGPEVGRIPAAIDGVGGDGAPAHFGEDVVGVVMGFSDVMVWPRDAFNEIAW
jgi:hypothetical protein